MRLGLQEQRLKPGTKAREIYGADVVGERHRHRYEFNNRYRTQLEDAGLVISAKSMDDTLVEMVELPGHPWFIACQAHPEFLSTPRDGHPLFIGFIRAAREYRARKAGARDVGGPSGPKLSAVSSSPVAAEAAPAGPVVSGAAR